jgi:predicted SnoaL-like aldol condensation-catalyzing enzyme
MMKKIIFISAFALVAACNPMSSSTSTMSPIQEKALVIRLYEGINRGSTIVMDSVFAADVITHQAPDSMSSGLPGAKEFIQGWMNKISGFHKSMDNVLADGNLVAVQYTLTGVNADTTAKNRNINFAGIDLYRLDKGKIVEQWGYWEQTKMMSEMEMMHRKMHVADTSIHHPHGKKHHKPNPQPSH